ADVLRANTRKTDMVARYGGEEFIIMLPETPLKGSRGVADRILSEVEKTAVLGAALEINFTVSLGLAYFTKGDTVDSLVARTDQALYTAKKNGRNRVELVTV
ncbi:MAG: GGDEF domain-containing protein, partial [Actinomycetota bacterium]|nr:GGDEF domain-containing protein [Actinomycetota bacterium]